MQNNPKAMWKTINKVLQKNSNHTVTQNIILEGTELKSASQISEAFNKHFTTVGPKLAEKIEIQPSDDPLNPIWTGYCCEDGDGGQTGLTVRLSEV